MCSGGSAATRFAQLRRRRRWLATEGAIRSRGKVQGWTRVMVPAKLRNTFQGKARGPIILRPLSSTSQPSTKTCIAAKSSRAPVLVVRSFFCADELLRRLLNPAQANSYSEQLLMLFSPCCICSSKTPQIRPPVSVQPQKDRTGSFISSCHQCCHCRPLQLSFPVALRL